MIRVGIGLDNPGYIHDLSAAPSNNVWHLITFLDCMIPSYNYMAQVQLTFNLKAGKVDMMYSIQ